MNNRRWYMVIGYDYDGEKDPTIIIAYDVEDVENWAAQRYSHYEITPAHEWIIDLTRFDRTPPSAGGAVASSKPVGVTA